MAVFRRAHFFNFYKENKEIKRETFNFYEKRETSEEKMYKREIVTYEKGLL